jgi:hypothetical protein
MTPSLLTRVTQYARIAEGRRSERAARRQAREPQGRQLEEVRRRLAARRPVRRAAG